MFSHNFNGPRVQYEIVIGVHNEQVFSAHCASECDMYSDLKISNMVLANDLEYQEQTIADRGYSQYKAWTPNTEYPEMQAATSRLHTKH